MADNSNNNSINLIEATKNKDLYILSISTRYLGMTLNTELLNQHQPFNLRTVNESNNENNESFNKSELIKVSKM